MFVSRLTLCVVFTVCFAMSSGCRNTQTGSGSGSTDSENHEWFLGVSEGHDEQRLKEVTTVVEKLLTQDAKAGDWIHVISLPSHQPVASIIIPEGSIRQRIRHQNIRDALPDLRTVLTTVVDEKGRVDIPKLATTVGTM